ncbi:MAG: type II secretion system F family protein [Alphaproteobacteria bacterium]|nr:type II secretion system F family protein [Alphaproteobacteria bacterium]
MTLDHILHDPDALAALCGAGAFAVVVLIWTALVETDPLPARLKNVTERRDELRHEERQKKLTRREGLAHKDFVKNLVQKLQLEQGKQVSQIRLKLARAGYRSRDAVMLYLLLRIALPIGTGFVVFFLAFVAQAFSAQASMKILAVIGGIIAGVMLPDIFIKNQSQKRETVLRKGIPDALDLMVICAEAGLSLDSALDRVSREIGPSCPELAEEVGLTGVELGFLPDRSRALQNLADRVPLAGVVALVNTLIQTEKYGTPLAQSLRVLSAEMRDERMMAAEAKAAKLPATLTIPMILFILPPLFIVLLGPAILRVMAMMHHH